MKTLLLFLVLLPLTIYSQGKFDLSGIVENDKGKPIPYANAVLNKGKKFAITNEKGFFIIKDIPKGKYTLTISSLGFQNFTKEVIIDRNINLGQLSLKTSTKNLESVTISAEKASTLKKEEAITIASLDVKDKLTQTSVVTDVIRKMSGVNIRNSGSLGDNSEIAINGLKGQAIRSYIDGIPMEFIYPGLGIAYLPITNIKRIDVYKGVMPVDIGTDALGGGINIITDKKYRNSLAASYSIGSFNTHIADLDITVFDSNQNYIGVTGAINYSDNNFKFRTKLLETNREAKVTRFHDQYRYQNGSVTIGTRAKKWADDFYVRVNYSNIFKEIQNGVIIQPRAIGDAFFKGYNLSGVMNYEKKLGKKLEVKSIFNASHQSSDNVDTSRVIYSWSGKVIGTSGSMGELNKTYTTIEINGLVNRTSFNYAFNEKHQLVFSNIVAYQYRIINNQFKDRTEDQRPRQALTKDIAGLQYTFKPFSKLEFTTAGKFYFHELKALENRNATPFTVQDNNWGFNAYLKYKISNGLMFRTSFEKAQRIPDFLEFFGDGIAISPNSALLNEKSDNLNFGLVYKFAASENFNFRSTFNLFYRDQKNLIRLDTQVPSRYENVDVAESKGGEAELHFGAFKKLSLDVNVTYQEVRYKDNFSPPNDFLNGERIPNFPSLFGNTQLSFTQHKLLQDDDILKAYVLFDFVDEFPRINVIENGDRNPENYVPTQQRLDVGISYTFYKKRITTSFNIINIADAELYDFYKVPKPPRSFNFKLIYRISDF